MFGSNCSPKPSFQTQGASAQTIDWPEVTSFARSRSIRPASETERGSYNPQNIYNMRPTDIHYEIADWAIAGNRLGNLWQGSVKDTALVSVVGLDDLMRKSSQAAQSTREPFTFYLAASLIFLLITLVSMLIIARLEKRASRGMAGAR